MKDICNGGLHFLLSVFPLTRFCLFLLLVSACSKKKNKKKNKAILSLDFCSLTIYAGMRGRQCLALWAGCTSGGLVACFTSQLSTHTKKLEVLDQAHGVVYIKIWSLRAAAGCWAELS